ncbi:hypothetical protein BDV40DRAFT_251819 [Aspergillus tamarii]|uniref:Zn(2)-C6 fungal-type domain-containing protein n=1 Tax=Aspergillus tamarii TaxID=41984 RepID=A0A5N6VBV5_ASPTM|nr:hypothetical protein BDV40DRAFT_251819 [Aspergillus tamarii]
MDPWVQRGRLDSSSEETPGQRQVACELCRRWKVKCQTASGHATCSVCQRRDVVCVRTARPRVSRRPVIRWGIGV